MTASTFNWSCNHTWKRSAINTAWCLLGCAIGDFGTILFFQITQIPWPVLAIMTLAIINGLITSIILETIILIRQNFKFKDNEFLDEKIIFKDNVGRIRDIEIQENTGIIFLLTDQGFIWRLQK